MSVATYEKASRHHETSHGRSQAVKRWLLPSSTLREFLKVLRVSLKVPRECPHRLGHLCDLRCEFSQSRGELGRVDDWLFDTRGRNEIAHNSEGIAKFVDFPGEMAKAKQIESRNVLEESHAVDRFPFDYPGLFNDFLDLILGTDWVCGHSDNVDRDLQGCRRAEAMPRLRNLDL
jgi:hypothetical protein